MEIKVNDDRLIQEYIRIQTKSAKYGVEAIARFLSDKMKTCNICIFQSDFGFLTSDVPFAVLIEKDRSSPHYSCDCCKIKFIDADWQFYRDYIYESDLEENSKKLFPYKQIPLSSWITCHENLQHYFDPTDQKITAPEFFAEMFEHYGDEFSCSETNLYESLFKYLWEDYGFCEEDIDYPEPELKKVGGFIVYEVKES